MILLKTINFKDDTQKCQFTLKFIPRYDEHIRSIFQTLCSHYNRFDGTCI